MTGPDAVDDMRAYVDTLDPAEALGELVHVSLGYIDTAVTLTAEGQERLSRVLMPLVVMLVTRFVEASGHPATPPVEHAVHTCDLLARGGRIEHKPHAGM